MSGVPVTMEDLSIGMGSTATRREVMGLLRGLASIVSPHSEMLSLMNVREVISVKKETR